MSKSTPISQLPSQSPTGFITDNQQQFVNEAQYAIQHASMPANTGNNPDIISDSATAIEEVLRSIQEETRTQPVVANNTKTDDVDGQKRQEDLALARQLLQQMNQQQKPEKPDQQAIIDALMMNNSSYSTAASDSFNVKEYILSFTDDIKLAAIIFVAVFIAHLSLSSQKNVFWLCERYKSCV